MDIDGVVKGLMSDKVIGVILESVFKIKVPGRTGRPRKTTFKDQIATGVVGGKLGLAALAVYALREKGVCSMEQGMAVVASVAERLDRIDIIDCFPSAKNWVVRDALARMGVDLTTDLTIEEMGSAAANVLKLYVEGQALMMASKAQQGVKAEAFDVSNLANIFGTGQVFGSPPLTRPKPLTKKPPSKEPASS